MFGSFIEGASLVLQWPAFGFLILGVLVGIWFGAVPGLGGIIALVLLLPFTYGMDPIAAFSLLIGIFAVTSTSDTISSVMLGIPGTAASQATILDGYPMAQKGEAARAFGAAFTVSAFGGVFGALVLALSLPILLPAINLFGSPELFALGILGLAMVGSLSGASITKGLAVATLGLLLATVGYAGAVTIPRYWFGSVYLLNGLPIIPLVLGLFAIPEVMDLAVRNVSIARGDTAHSKDGGMLRGIRDAVSNWWLATRCAAIGTYIGILPGLGGAVVDWIAYGHVVQSTKDKSGFGHGDVRGVIAPEAANNASRGGALIPMVAFGIPGSLAVAILLNAMLIHGLRPGPAMLTTDVEITFAIIWMLVLANLLASGLLMITSRQIARVAFIPGHVIVPGIVAIIFMGAWLARAAPGDWILLVAASILGFAMKRGGWPRAPLILAFILGPILEQRFQIATDVYGNAGWLLRPIVLIILALTLVTVVLAARGTMNAMRSPNGSEGGGQSSGQPASSASSSAVASWLLALGFLLLYLWAFVESLQWPLSVSIFPWLALVPGLVLVGAALWTDTLSIRGSSRGALATFGGLTDFRRAIVFLSYIIAILFIGYVIGQKLALTLFVATYLVRWGGFGWRVVLPYAFGTLLVLIGLYDHILHLAFWPSLLSRWLPEWLPQWIFLLV